MIIANGRKDDVLKNIFNGDDEGTLFLPHDTNHSKRKSWIAFFNKVEGTVVVDNGAAKALTEQGKSLLPIGITEVQENFKLGSLIQIKTIEGKIIARGLTEFSSEKLNEFKGTKSNDEHAEAIHRDNLVLL